MAYTLRIHGIVTRNEIHEIDFDVFERKQGERIKTTCHNVKRSISRKVYGYERLD
jgi:hypothetical protein